MKLLDYGYWVCITAYNPSTSNFIPYPKFKISHLNALEQESEVYIEMSLDGEFLKTDYWPEEITYMIREFTQFEKYTHFYVKD